MAQIRRLRATAKVRQSADRVMPSVSDELWLEFIGA